MTVIAIDSKPRIDKNRIGVSVPTPDIPSKNRDQTIPSYRTDSPRIRGKAGKASSSQDDSDPKDWKPISLNRLFLHAVRRTAAPSPNDITGVAW
ncbi:hypothetical protein ABZN20_12375 [Methylococcus sp. ANG]|uniref:hypothetical protein n=1 Tax=unclassified Methylococcus TaxID=2618889 RepID=UPI001C5341EA|nr:hypothetical protein [Methylococcus sp. Mc7]QXP85459.1 hypothetical protein KW115_07035 [Methylococcus sp. Mc7]